MAVRVTWRNKAAHPLSVGQCQCARVPVCQCVCVSVHGCTRCTSLAKPGADVHIVKSCSTLLSLSMYRHHTPTAITIPEAEQVL